MLNEDFIRHYSSSVLGRERMETHRFYFSVGRENETKDFPSLGPFLAMSLNRSFIAIVFFQLSTLLGCCILLQPLTTHTRYTNTSRYL